MSKTRKIWLGVFTFLPIIFFILYFVFFFAMFFGTFQEMETSNEPPRAFFLGIGAAIVSMIIAIISSLAMLIYYIIHAVKNPKFDSNRQLMWIIILVLASGIGSIIYYFVEILPDGKSNQNAVGFNKAKNSI